MLFVLLNFANENIKTKQNCSSPSNTAAFNFLMHVLNELGESFGALNHWRVGFETDHHQIDRCITSKYRESGSKACRVICSLQLLLYFDITHGSI